ncbi:MAG: hypothetical protein ACMZI0_19215 [Symbiopectobacterium sp.]|uniref:hypothetical protein n=1 Tax=Symbiopectobacterium sp. TaxID=2952789 RepID=UPI0039ECBA25
MNSANTALSSMMINLNHNPALLEDSIVIIQSVVMNITRHVDSDIASLPIW